MMRIKKYFVIEELLELSQKSDEIIKNSLACTTIDDNFFEEATNKVRQILEGSHSKRKLTKSPSRTESCGFKFRLRHSLQPLLNYREHVHLKNKGKIFEIQGENSCNKKFLADVTNKDSNGSHLVSIAKHNGKEISAAPTKVESQNKDSAIEIKSDCIIEVNESWGKGSKGCLNSNGTPGLINQVASPIKNSKTVCCQISPNSHRVTRQQLTPDAKLLNYETGKTYVVKKRKLDKLTFINDKDTSNSENISRSTRSGEKYAVTANDKSRSILENSLKEEGLDKTIVISSDGSKENIEFSEESYKTPSSSSTCSLSTDLRLKLNARPKKRMRTRILPDINPDFNKDSTIANTLEYDDALQMHKLEKSEESGFFSCSHPSLEVEENAVKHKPTIKYRLRSLENMSSDWKKINDSPGVIETRHLSPHVQNAYVSTCSNVTGKGLSELNGLSNIQSSPTKKICLIPFRQSNKKRISRVNKSPNDLGRESSNKGKRSGIKKYKRIVLKEDTMAKPYGKILYDNKIKGSEKWQTQFQAQSTPTDHKKGMKRKFRPSLKVESSALKVKEEEKRKQREIRVQRTKERREHLEKERMERIRLSEQRRKQKFQQHEEMLKEKTKKFKIKPQNRQHPSTKRNLESTSSKDSKEDRAEDNDNFCRNAADSGQKLSKEGNGYRDVSLKKVGLASLEGSVGMHPDISQKDNAILVGCKKTPVEFAISCNGAELKEAENAPLSQVDRKIREFHFGSLKEHDKLQRYKRLDTTNSKSIDKDVSNNLKPINSSKPSKRKLKQDLTSTDETFLKTLKLKKIDRIKLFSDQMFSKSTSEKNNSYFLRSAQKVYPSKNLKTDVSVSPMMDIFQSKPKNGKKNWQFPCVTSPSVSKGGNSYFKNLKNHKSRKLLKISTNESYQSNGGLARSKEQEGNAKYFNKASAKKLANKTPGTAPKKLKLKSYKIPDCHDDSFDDSELDIKEIPSWASGLYLKEALFYQNYKLPDVGKIFGIPNGPVDLVDMFSMDKPEYHKRTSSEHWTIDPTSTTDAAKKYKYIN